MLPDAEYLQEEPLPRYWHQLRVRHVWPVLAVGVVVLVILAGVLAL